MSLINKIIAYVLVILLLLSVGFNVYGAIKIHFLKKDIVSLQDEKGKLQQSLDNCNGSIDKRNRDVLDEQKKADQKQQSLDTLKKQLDEQQQQNKELIKKMADTPAPKTCEDTKSYLKQNVGVAW